MMLILSVTWELQLQLPYTSNNIAIWTNAINQSISNHFAAITNLYAKGVRTLIMPDAVDITEIPYYSANSVA